MADGYSGVLDSENTPPDGSTGFFSHLWNNIKLDADAALDAGIQLGSLGTVKTHFTADQAAAQLAAGLGQPVPTADQISNAEQLEDQMGGGLGVGKVAAEAAASDAEKKISSAFKWGVAGLVVAGVIYAVIVTKPLRALV